MVNGGVAAAAAEFDGPAGAGIDLRGVSVSFGGRTVFADVDFSAERGMVVGLMGPNGSGKSTMLNILAGLVVPQRGEGYVMGYRLGSARHAPFGMMFEHPPFVERASGRENLILLSRLKGTRDADTFVRAGACMQRVGLDPERAEPVACYSQGMRKRLGLAQAVLGSPPLYLLDEPMNGLDPLGVVVMRSCIRTLAARGAIVVVSSHLLNELERVCTKVYMFHEGTASPVALDAYGPDGLEQVYVDSVLGNAKGQNAS